MYEYGGARGVTRACPLTRTGSKRQHMGEMAPPLSPDERQRNAGSSDGRIAPGGCEKRVLHARIDLRFARHQSAGGHAQDVGLVDEDVPSSVGMNNTSVCIDEKNCGTKTVKRLRKHRRFGLFDVEDLGDEDRK